MDDITFYKAKLIIVWHEDMHRSLENAYMCVKGTIVEGFYTEAPEGARVIDLGESAICPGFVNLHSHPSEAYSLKSYREDIGNPNFFESTLYDYCLVINMGIRGAELQTRLNLAEMIKSGCTTALIYGGRFSEMEAEAAGAVGIRAYVGGAVRAGGKVQQKGIWHSPDGHSLEYRFDEKEGMDRLAEAVEFIKTYNGSFQDRIRGIMAPTQTMTCTPALLKASRREAEKLQVPITIHGSEAPIEVESCVRTYGMTPVQYMYDNGMLGEDVTVAHCLYITGHPKINFRHTDDLELLGRTKTNVAHCPWALARHGDILYSFRKYKEAGVNMCLGTDTFESDFIQEMRYAAGMAKIADSDLFATSAKDVFYAATTGGAKALGRTDIGRLEAGSKADFTVVKLNSIEMSPCRDFVKNLVYSATGHSVSQVYVDGECIMKDGIVRGIQEEELCRELQDIAVEAWNKTGQYDVKGRNVDQLSPLSCKRYLPE